MVKEIKNYTPRQMSVEELQKVVRFKAIWKWQLNKLHKIKCDGKD